MNLRFDGNAFQGLGRGDTALPMAKASSTLF